MALLCFALEEHSRHGWKEASPPTKTDKSWAWPCQMLEQSNKRKMKHISCYRGWTPEWYQQIKAMANVWEYCRGSSQSGHFFIDQCKNDT